MKKLVLDELTKLATSKLVVMSMRMSCILVDSKLNNKSSHNNHQITDIEKAKDMIDEELKRRGHK